MASRAVVVADPLQAREPRKPELAAGCKTAISETRAMAASDSIAASCASTPSRARARSAESSAGSGSVCTVSPHESCSPFGRLRAAASPSSGPWTAPAACPPRREPTRRCCQCRRPGPQLPVRWHVVRTARRPFWTTRARPRLAQSSAACAAGAKGAFERGERRRDSGFLRSRRSSNLILRGRCCWAA